MVRLYLREWREAKGLSLMQLMARTKLAATTIARIEAGERSWTSGDLEQLSEALEMLPADLLGLPPK